MYERGDLVLVAGSSCDGKTYKNYQFMVVQVEEVGEYDLFVMPISETSSYLKKPYIISKKSCQKVELSDLSTHTRPVQPKIGDLVLIYEETYKETIKEVGILMSISTKPGTTMKAHVLVSNKKIEVKYDSLMLIDKKCKN